MTKTRARNRSELRCLKHNQHHSVGLTLVGAPVTAWNSVLSVLRLAAAAGCLIGADSETSAAALLSCVPDLDSGERRGQVARWLHDLYPGPKVEEAETQEGLRLVRAERVRRRGLRPR